MAKAVKLFPKVVRSPETHDFKQASPGYIATMNDGEIGKHQSPASLDRFRFADEVPIQPSLCEIAGKALLDPAVVLLWGMPVEDGIAGTQMGADFPPAKHTARNQIETFAP